MFPLLLALSAFAARPKDRAPDPSQTPVIPAPEGDLYVAAAGTPRDSLVAAMVVGLGWDEALSGAAGSLALEAGPNPDLARARWAAWRAGYPHPIRALVLSHAAPGELPSDLRETLEAALRPGESLGLVRARMGDEDRWVGLIGQPRIALDPLPRAIGLGEAVPLGGVAGLGWTLVSPSGRALRGALPASPRLNEAGEWWLEIRGADGAPAVTLPVYVGVPAAPDAPLALPGEAVTGPDSAGRLSLALLSELRASFDQPDFEEDPTLALLARGSASGLAERGVASGSWDREAEAHRLVRAGFPEGAEQLRCAGETVALCLDSLLRSAPDRAALLSGDHLIIGVGAEVSTQGLGLVINLAAE